MPDPSPIAGDSLDWDEMDPWWETAVDLVPFVVAPKPTFELAPSVVEDDWEVVDNWWTAFLSKYSLPEIQDADMALNGQWRGDAWADLDSWWDTYVAIQHGHLEELRDVMREIQADWAESDDGPTDDPLQADWRTNQRESGPLRINQEENWSQWLAHLLRLAPPTVRGMLFGSEFAGEPATVEREVHLRDPVSADRFADIVVFYDEVGVSIEVKKGDEHYEKTTHTASLLESHFPGLDWTHHLLLPETKLEPLRRSFDENLVDPPDQHPRIRSSPAGDVILLFWRDVSHALREVLRGGVDRQPHWEASAFLFTTLIEQKLLNLSPIPVVERLVQAKDIVRTETSMVHSGSDIEEQISYLRDTMEGQADE